MGGTIHGTLLEGRTDCLSPCPVGCDSGVRKGRAIARNSRHDLTSHTLNFQSKCNGYEWKGPMGSRYDGVCLRQPDVGRIPWAGIPILP